MGQVQIIQAIYGTQQKNIDVTSIIQNCSHKVEITNSLFGSDPHPWANKYLQIAYTRDGKNYVSTLEEHGFFDIKLLPSRNFLCICEGGNVRSVSLAYVLKDHFHQNALAASWRWNSPETLELLCTWADYILIMQGIFLDKIPVKHRTKVHAVDVGPDRFGNAFHPDLIKMLMPVVQGWSDKSFEINR